MINFKEKVGELILSQINDGDIDDIVRSIEIPPNYNMGDYAFPAFRLSKTMKKAPNIIAEEIVEKISDNKYFEKIEAKGPYINFFVDKNRLVETTLTEIIESKEGYGSSTIGKDKTVIVEFSSPNIAKPFHIGHVRTTVIGNALYNIYTHLGFDTVSVNHLGDYGTQFGMLIAAYKMWGNEDVKRRIERDPIPELLKLYVKFNEEAEKDESLRDDARYWFRELENKNEEALELWSWIREVSLKEFNRVYDMLGIEFDSYAGEAFYSDKMDGIIETLEEKELLELSDDAYIVDLEEYDMPPALIKKSDGSTLYMTRDLAAAVYRKETYDFYKNLYVVASEQNLHFKSLFKVLELMGYEWAKDCEHVPFGMISLEDGALSTRKGRVVFLEDVLNNAINKTLDIINERNPNLENKEEVSKEVGIGAVVFQELFNQRIKDYTFSWERTLSFEGETGPYVQYTHARANSILKRGNFDIKNEFDYSLLNTEEEINIIRELYKFPDSVLNAMEKNEPYYVTRQVMEIAQSFNRFYNSTQILIEDEKLMKARLMLTYATKTTLKTGLSLLGIKAPDKM